MLKKMKMEALVILKRPKTKMSVETPVTLKSPNDYVIASETFDYTVGYQYFGA